MVKNLPVIQEIWAGKSLGWKDLLEEGMATHSGILACRIPMDRNPAGYSPWGRKESHTTERLNKGTYHEDEPFNYIYLDSLATGRIQQTESRMTGKM